MKILFRCQLWRWLTSNIFHYRKYSRNIYLKLTEVIRSQTLPDTIRRIHSDVVELFTECRHDIISCWWFLLQNTPKPPTDLFTIYYFHVILFISFSNTYLTGKKVNGFRIFSPQIKLGLYKNFCSELPVSRIFKMTQCHY